MIRKESFGLINAVAVASLLLVMGRLQAAEPPLPPALSSLVPVEDLVAQVEYYVEELEECVEDSQEFEDSAEKIERYAGTVAVLALSVGLHDQDTPLRRAAPVLVKVSQELAVSKDFSSARMAVSKLKAALTSTGNPAALKWGKVADLHALMEQVPLINTRIKRYMRRFEKGIPYVIGNSAALVAIGQGSMPNADETEAPDKVAEWYKFCIQMRDSASALNKAAHANDEAAAETAMKALQQSCDDCHAVFHQEDK